MRQPCPGKDKLVLDQSGESNTTTTDSKAYEGGMGLLFILGTAAVFVAVVYMLSYFD